MFSAALKWTLEQKAWNKTQGKSKSQNSDNDYFSRI